MPVWAGSFDVCRGNPDIPIAVPGRSAERSGFLHSSSPSRTSVVRSWVTRWGASAGSFRDAANKELTKRRLCLPRAYADRRRLVQAN